MYNEPYRLLNAFSLNMLNESCCITATIIDAKEARERLEHGWESAVGHADIAAVMSCQLGLEIAHNRATINLPRCSRAIVAQYIGPRLAEGATELPKGATIRWYLLHIS